MAWLYQNARSAMTLISQIHESSSCSFHPILTHTSPPPSPSASCSWDVWVKDGAAYLFGIVSQGWPPGPSYCSHVCSASSPHSLLPSPYSVFPKYCTVAALINPFKEASYQYPTGKKDDYCKDMGDNVGPGDFKITQRDKLVHTNFLTHF